MTVKRHSILRRRRTSCGCLYGKHSIKHGKSRSGPYCVWENMIQRCNNPKTPHYYNYGGRGIKVCKRWKSFENFYEDMGDRPKGTSLERIDNDGDYEPGNCRWATQKEQMRNTRRTSFLTIGGVTKPRATWAEEAGIGISTLKGRIRRGWPEDKLLIPVHSVGRG